MKRILFVGIASLGMAGPAAAQEVEDLEIVVANLGPASEALVDGLTNTVETLADSQSAVDTFAAGGDTVESTGSTLVAGSSLGDLSLALTLNNNAAQQIAGSYLELIDDPSAENLEAAFNPEDLETIAGNLEAAQEALIEGDGFGGGEHGNGLRAAAIEMLQGNLGEAGALGPTDGAASYTMTGIAGGSQELTAGTNYELAAQAVAVNLLVGSVAAAPVFDAYNDPFATVFETAEPATTPVIDAIAGFGI